MDAKLTTARDGRRKTVRDECDHPCAIERGMRVIGGKWKGSILWHLRAQPVRFNDLDRLLSGVSKKMLTQRLREMEDDGLLIRHVVCERPIAVTYEITDFGRSALGVLETLMAWSEERLAPERFGS